MSMKARVKAFIPPIVWSGLKGVAARLNKRPPGAGATEDQGAGRTILSLASGQSFAVEFRRVSTSSGTFFVPEYAAHRPASECILSGTLYEPDTHALIAMLMKLRPGSLVHAGTFFGDMLPSFARACPSTVYAFEPVLESFIMAKLCIQENELDNVLLMNAGLGESASVARIDTGDEAGVHQGGSAKIGSRGQFTSLITIDSLGIPDLSVIQLDVEGHELEALKGGIDTIRKNAPIVLIEDNKNNCGSFLKSLGYARRGEVPGLSIWASENDRKVVDWASEALSLAV